MTTNTNTAVFDNGSDAAFRAWIIDFHNLISGAGLIQTADTGQINTATVLRPAANTMAGYSVWKLPGSDPLYFKFQFGCGTTNARPVIQMQVGEGSNGTGTLTGQTSTNVTLSITNQDINSTVTLYTSYACVTNDYLGFIFKHNSKANNGACGALAAVGKTVDNTGAATTLGYYKVYNPNDATTASVELMQCVRRQATAVTMNPSNRFTVDPTLNQTNSQDDSGNLQISMHWGTFKQVLPCLYSCTYRTSELGAVTTFNVAMIGATSHTYITCGPSSCNTDPAGSTGNKLAILYE